MAFDSALAQKVRKQLVETSARFGLIEPDDRIMVCVSGGKDSSSLLVLLTEVQRKAPHRFEIQPVMLDQGHPGFDPRDYCQWVQSRLGLSVHVISQDTLSIVKSKIPEGGTYCSLCSRLRRGILYDYAAENAYNKMALGHHREDLNETLLLNLFFTGKISSMPPKLKSDDGRNIVIRPLCEVAESDLQQLATEWGFPIIPCNLCGSQDELKRKKMKEWIKTWEKEIPQIRNSMLSAQGNVRVSQMMDDSLWDFHSLQNSFATPLPQVPIQFHTNAPIELS